MRMRPTGFEMFFLNPHHPGGLWILKPLPSLASNLVVNPETEDRGHVDGSPELLAMALLPGLMSSGLPDPRSWSHSRNLPLLAHVVSLCLIGHARRTLR